MTAGDSRALADAIASTARQQGEATPAVRGADWQTAIVTAVDATPGTVDCGAIRARRLPTYLVPAVGDQIVITRSGSGNWLAVGTLSATSGTWQTLTLASGYSNPGHGYTASYLREGRRVTLRGRIGANTGTIASGATIATLPAAIRPADSAVIGWAAPRNGGASDNLIRMEITDAGVLHTFESVNPPTWVSLDGVSYFTD